jgi:Winged helix DNA-binding domain
VARSVGGAAPYLTLFARAGTSREAADSAVANLEILELPAARGCTYVVPSADFALALRAGQSFGGAEMKVAYKLGVTDKEIDKLCDAVVKALGKAVLKPDEIREGVGGAARNLGDEGKKKGLATTLPLALGRLQAMGEIRRVPVNGRLDQQRFKYARWRPNPRRGLKTTEEQAATELAQRFFSWIGPATPAEFQAFSGLGVKAAQAAMEPLNLESPRGSMMEERFILPKDRAEFEAFEAPKQACYVLVSSLDWVAAASMTNPPHHAILDRGRIVGLWAYDTATESIAWRAFVEKNKDLEEAVAWTEEFVRAQLGDARSFSLDSPRSRAKGIEALRQTSQAAGR